MKPYYQDSAVTIYHGDCREILPSIDAADVVITDPPYGVTDLEWDRRVAGWRDILPTRSLWCFGSLKAFLAVPFTGWTYAQEIVWEKHNGSNLMVDRFRRVHELVVHFYRGAWADVFKSPLYTMDATARTIRTRTKPAHCSKYESKVYTSQNGGPRLQRSVYTSQNGGPRLQRSVLRVRSEHGRAVHPTQKPLGILRPLVEYSCPPRGTVLDPFVGSGSTLVAARSLGCKAIGIEIEERYCEIAARRCAQEVMDLAGTPPTPEAPEPEPEARDGS